LTRADLIAEVSRRIAITEEEAREIVETIFRCIVRGLGRDGKVEIRGFGSFRRRVRRARTAHNPKTGVKVAVPAKKIPYFRPSKELLAAMQSAGAAPKA
jgi:integration host factor subunit beta